MKSYNIRDQTTEQLYKDCEQSYKRIDAMYRQVKRLSKLEDAKQMIERIWTEKRYAAAMEFEILRRDWNGKES